MNTSEEYRHQCELRYICGLTLNARRRYLALVLENRGIKAQQHLKDELEKMDRQNKPNSDEHQKNMANSRYKYNKVTHKMDDLSPEEIKDKINSIDEIEKDKYYNGQEIFSYIIPEGINNKIVKGDKVAFEIANGKIIKGVLDKSTLSTVKNSIIHFIWELQMQILRN